MKDRTFQKLRGIDVIARSVDSSGNGDKDANYDPGDWHRCSLCNYEWMQRKRGKPKRCPRRECNTPNWDSIRDEETKEIIR